MIPRYTLPEMGAIWSDAARFEAMLRVELAVARAQAARGQVPPDALAALETRSRVDIERIAEIERTTDHDVIAFVSQVAETVGPEGRYLHLGLTSSDVVDTGLALQLRAAGERLLLDTDRLLAVLILGMLSNPAWSWVYPEHRNLSLLAAQRLGAEHRAVFDRLWQEARVGDEQLARAAGRGSPSRPCAASP
jgi:hypothetical protein